MNLVELKTMLDSLEIPVAYLVFKTPQTVPFITFVDTGSDNFAADNQVYHEIENVDIELYTEYVDLTLEDRLEQLLSSNELYYDYSRVWIDSEKIYKITYEVTLT